MPVTIATLPSLSSPKSKTELEAAQHANAEQSSATGVVSKKDIKSFNDVLEKEPRNKYAFYNLGLIAQVSGDKPVAETNYRQAVSIDPKFTSALYNLAIVRKAVGDTTSAITFYRQAIAADPNNPAPHFNLGILLRATGDKALGDAEIAKAVELNPALASRVPVEAPGGSGGSGPGGSGVTGGGSGAASVGGSGGSGGSGP